MMLVALALAPAAAHANAPDTFGFTPRIAGLAGAGTAEARGAAAAFHNPAGVALSDDIEAVVAYSYAGMALKLDGRDANVTSPRGTSLGLSLPAHLGPLCAAFGVAVYLPDQFIARIQLVPATEPHFALLDNNLHHIVVTPALAFRPLPWLSLVLLPPPRQWRAIPLSSESSVMIRLVPRGSKRF